MNDKVLRATPGVIAVFLAGILLGSWIGRSPGVIGFIVGACVLVMVIAAVFRAINQRETKERVSTSV